MALFIKPDGFDGESKDADHDKWIDGLQVDWGAAKPGGGASGQSRRRGAAIVEDLTLTTEFDKSTPKFKEKCLKGEIIPKVEIHCTATYGGARAIYLKYELEKVMVTSFHVNHSGNDEVPPTVVVGLNFEKVKQEYTEYDDDGGSGGNVAFEFEVEKGK